MKPRESAPRLLLDLHYYDFIFLPVGHFWLLPADRKGKEPTQQDRRPLGAERGFPLTGHLQSSAAQLPKSVFILNASRCPEEAAQGLLLRNSIQGHQSDDTFLFCCFKRGNRESQDTRQTDMRSGCDLPRPTRTLSAASGSRHSQSHFRSPAPRSPKR